MAHFTINLPDNTMGEVNYGRVFKNSLFNPFRIKKSKEEPKTGYIVRLTPKIEGQEKYMLYKSKEGKWSKDPEGNISVGDETILKDIKEAIIKKENELSSK